MTLTPSFSTNIAKWYYWPFDTRTNSIPTVMDGGKLPTFSLRRLSKLFVFFESPPLGGLNLNYTRMLPEMPFKYLPSLQLIQVSCTWACWVPGQGLVVLQCITPSHSEGESKLSTLLPCTVQLGSVYIQAVQLQFTSVNYLSSGGEWMYQYIAGIVIAFRMYG